MKQNYVFTHTALHEDKQLVHVTLVGLSAAAEIHIGQLYITAAFFDTYLSWCVFHRKRLPSELCGLLPALLLDRQAKKIAV